MKNFNFTDENINRSSTFNNFLDNLDTDITSSVDTLVPENINNLSLESNALKNSTEQCTALTVAKPNSLFVAQKMFRKSIKLSIKSFLISLSLGFLNLFI